MIIDLLTNYDDTKGTVSSKSITRKIVKRSVLRSSFSSLQDGTRKIKVLIQTLGDCTNY